MRLFLSTHDGRCSWGRPYALVDRDSGQLVGSFRSLADGKRAWVLLDQVHSYSRDLSATELTAVASETCERLFGSREFERLSPPKLNRLIPAIRTELRGRKR